MSKMEKWDSFPHAKSCADLIEYFNYPREHKKYCHYTSLDSINNILKNFEFFIPTSENFNDRTDKLQFLEDEKDKNSLKRNYIICFTTGSSENLPLWYFYSEWGKGGRLRFTNNLFYRAFKYGKFTLCEFNDNQPIREGEIELINGVNADFILKDILYYKEDKSKKIVARYNNMMNTSINDSTFDEARKSFHGFLKSVLWYYEKETRLVIRLSDELYNKVLASGKNYKVIWNFSDEVIYSRSPHTKRYKVSMNNGICVDLNPNITKEGKANTLSSYEQILRLPEANIGLSEYSGEIELKR